MTGPTVWFRLPVGRQKNADPRWLLPMICRLGKITKQDIGAIRIFERETKFEIDAKLADKFIAALATIEKPEFRIERLVDGAERAGDRGEAPVRSGPGKAGGWKGKPSNLGEGGPNQRKGAHAKK